MAIAYSDKNHILDETLNNIAKHCINCDLCIRECGFIQKYGKPGHITQFYDPENAGSRSMAFECSLCPLRTAVCPVGLDPGKDLPRG